MSVFGCPWRSEEGFEPLELDLQMVVSHTSWVPGTELELAPAVAFSVSAVTENFLSARV